MNNLFQQLQNQQQTIQMSQPQQAPQKLLQSKNKALLQNFLKSSNPTQMLQNMIQSNPKMQNIMQLFNSSGMTPKQFFYQYAEQQGINPDEFLNSLK